MKTLILLISLGFVGCSTADSNSNVTVNKPSTPSPTVAQHRDGVRRVTTAELADLIKQGKVLVVDVRTKDAYDRGHIPQAKLLPINEVGERGKELPRDRMIVTYCSWPAEQTSAGAAGTLKKQGYENVAALLGGFELWEKEGRPVNKVKWEQAVTTVHQKRR